MKVRAPLVGVVVFSIGLFASRLAGSKRATGRARTIRDPGPPTTTQTTTLPPQTQQTQGSAPLRVMVGKSLLINTTERLKRVAVTDPTIADPTVITPTQILVHGRSPGEVSLLIWDELERSRSFDLRVDVDVSTLRGRRASGVSG